MKKERFRQLIDWATSQIGHYAMSGYLLKEVNELGRGKVTIILAEYHQKEPIAEVLVSDEGDGYLGQFRLLPNKEGPNPQLLTLKTTNILTLIEWLRTGHDPETGN